MIDTAVGAMVGKAEVAVVGPLLSKQRFSVTDDLRPSGIDQLGQLIRSGAVGLVIQTDRIGDVPLAAA